MNTWLRKWLPIALCCLPGVAVAAIIGLGLAFGGATVGTLLGGPLGLGLIALATGFAVACPVSTGLMMWRGSKQSATHGTGSTSMIADCCAPGEASAASETGSLTDRLAALQAQREALERELAEMRTQ